jgi:hypothetical protein
MNATHNAESVAGGEVNDTVSEAWWMARSARGRAARLRQRLADQIEELETDARNWDHTEEFWMARMSEDERAYYLRQFDGTGALNG